MVFSSLGFLSQSFLQSYLSLLYPVKGISKDKEKAGKLCDDQGRRRAVRLSIPLNSYHPTQNTYWVHSQLTLQTSAKRDSTQLLGERKGSHHAAVPLGRGNGRRGDYMSDLLPPDPLTPQHACSLSSTESPPRMNVLRDPLLQLPGAKSREAGSCPRKAVRGGGEPRVLGSSRSSVLRLACNF